MQLKITVAVLLVLMLIVLVPAASADSIRAPNQPGFDVASAITSSLHNGTAPQSLTFHPDRDHDPDPVPEPGSIVPLVLLAAGAFLLRRRLTPIR
ncbi:MAG TPA: PEP-CTERM sorting domain-containing protein [Bryobacteraceae bacterium]|nr:PEP-CTERM sorting domain-containing protein [Bryobacteraceae bacterium]